MNEALRIIRQIFINALIIAACMLLQVSVIPYLKLGSVMPNLMLIIVATSGLMRGRNHGMLIGFFSGLLLDMFSSHFIGYYALIYTLVGLLNGFFRRWFYGGDLKMPLGMIAASDLIYGTAVFVSLFLPSGNLHFVYYLLNIMLPEAVYTVVISLILYPLIYLINQWLYRDEQRREYDIV